MEEDISFTPGFILETAGAVSAARSIRDSQRLTRPIDASAERMFGCL
jgi:hypothetical protein